MTLVAFSRVAFILNVLQKQGSISMVLSPPCVKAWLLWRPNPYHGERRAGILVLLHFFCHPHKAEESCWNAVHAMLRSVCVQCLLIK